MNKNILTAIVAATLVPLTACAGSDFTAVSDSHIAKQRATLELNTDGKGFGPQSPRNIDTLNGTNARIFGEAPKYQDMNLCNIHMHKNAEHQGGEFNKYAGNGDGAGYQTGFVYSGKLTAAETKKINKEICPSPHGGLYPGDTIEVHYVHTTAQAEPGHTLGACLGDSITNIQARVETQVFVVVNDKSALDFGELTKHAVVNGRHQALNIPNNTGTPIQYAGSTTGPSYNEKASPFQVSWSVRPKVAKVDIETVGKWCQGNAFKEDHAHGVRNLVTNPKLLSQM